MSSTAIKEVKLYNADTLEYAGSMVVNGSTWDYIDVKDSFLIEVTKGMTLKSVFPCLISFNLVYDIIES
ncbi:MAG TPA: hypothetical protein PKG60_02545 [Spirochaetota bacterium]|nr:hypothetical protein [Spirochaetota bacterium]HPS85320.1 hypothetical protein [Spirochaetota bacterium]